jgi:hypothetical protein
MESHGGMILTGKDDYGYNTAYVTFIEKLKLLKALLLNNIRT